MTASTAPRSRVVTTAVIGTVSIAASAWYLARELHAVGHLGFPLDDAWIHAQFARNLASGFGLSFNPGEPSAGSTSPLWTAIVAIGMFFGLAAPVSAAIFGLAFGAGSAMLTASLTQRLTGSRWAGVVGGLSVALSARMTWASVSGMEVPLATVLLLLTLRVYVTRPDRAWLWGGVCALAGTARPELFPLAALLVAHRIGRADDGPRVGPRIREAATACGVFALVLGGYALINWSIAGSMMPSTFAAKSKAQGVLYALSSGDLTELLRSVTVRPIENVTLLVRFCFDQSQVLLATFLVGALAAGGALRGVAVPPGSGLLVAFIALQAGLVGALAPDVPVYGQEGRYVLPLLSLFFIVAAIGLSALARLSRSRWPVVMLAVVAVARLASQDVQFAHRYVAQVDNIERLHVATGRWLAGSLAATDVVATNDIGAIAYFSGRRIVDMEGLVTPAMIPYKRGGRQLDFLEQARPAVLVVFPEWYPQVVSRSDLFTEIHRVTVPRVSAAHDSLVIYRTPWGAPR